MKIAFISYEDSKDIKAWSGTISFMAKYLGKKNEIIRVDNLSRPIDYFFKALNYAWVALGKSADYKRNRLFVKIVCKRIQKELDKLDYDIIFAPGSTYITFLKSDKPIVVWADATYISMVGFHFQYNKLNNRQIKYGDYLEQVAFDKCSKLIFSTNRVAESAQNDYKISQEKIEVIPFGANLIHNHNRESIVELNKLKSTSKVKLLFIGVYWYNKGGDILLEIFDELRKMDSGYELEVVGSTPKEKKEISGVNFYGFLDKSIPEQKDKLESLFESSHYFILPTRSEAYGISFVEANSYGLPVFGSNLGGVPDIIEDGINGELMDIEKSAKFLANQIHNYISEGDYNKKSLKAFDHYKENFTWDNSIKRVNNLLEKLVYENKR